MKGSVNLSHHEMMKLMNFWVFWLPSSDVCLVLDFGQQQDDVTRWPRPTYIYSILGTHKRETHKVFHGQQTQKKKGTESLSRDSLSSGFKPKKRAVSLGVDNEMVASGMKLMETEEEVPDSQHKTELCHWDNMRSIPESISWEQLPTIFKYLRTFNFSNFFYKESVL